jgi:NADP-dependent 3-hydroxy acid dehydrogenase YdfG
VIITGSSSGMGEAVAYDMARDGSWVFLIGRSGEKLEKVCAEVERRGGKAFYSAGDIGDEATVDRMFVEAIKHLEWIDLAFLNAGVGYFGNLESLTVKQYDEQFKTNVRGVFLWLRKILPHMRGRNAGQIIATSSNLGIETSPRAGVYSATKHAVQAMIWCLREELKGTNVKASTINPGSVATPWFKGRNVDTSKMLSPEDIVRTVRYIVEQPETSNIDHVLLKPGRS